MSFDAIEAGSRGVVDANILLYATAKRSRQCVEFVRQVASGEFDAVISTITLAELCHRWMMEDAKSKGFAGGGNPARALAGKRNEIGQFTVYSDLMMAMLNSRFSLRSIEPADFTLALQFQHRWGLMTNDSLLLALAERLGIKQIATADSDFDEIRGLVVHHPDDLQ